MTRQAMYVKRNTEARTCKHSYIGNAIRIAYSECALVDLGILHAMCKRHIVICGLPFFAVFFHIISWKQDFRKKRYETWNVCSDFLYNFCL